MFSFFFVWSIDKIGASLKHSSFKNISLINFMKNDTDWIDRCFACIIFCPSFNTKLIVLLAVTPCAEKIRSHSSRLFGISTTLQKSAVWVNVYLFFQTIGRVFSFPNSTSSSPYAPTTFVYFSETPSTVFGNFWKVSVLICFLSSCNYFCLPDLMSLLKRLFRSLSTSVNGSKLLYHQSKNPVYLTFQRMMLF